MTSLPKNKSGGQNMEGAPRGYGCGGAIKVAKRVVFSTRLALALFRVARIRYKSDPIIAASINIVSTTVDITVSPCRPHLTTASTAMNP